MRTEGESWMTPILNFLISNLLLEDQAEAKKVKRQATSYTVVNGDFF